MMNTPKYGPWYTANTSNGQGLVCREVDGANIAVTYEKEYAPLVAAAPDLLAGCVAAESWLSEYEDGPDVGVAGLIVQLRTAIANAECVQPE